MYYYGGGSCSNQTPYYPVYNYNTNSNSNFAIILVLFILLVIIIGTRFVN